MSTDFNPTAESSLPFEVPSYLPPYAELHCRSNFTFLRGASSPEELIARAAELNYAALAITDECSLAGVVRAHVEAKERQLHLIVGADICFTLDNQEPLAGEPTAAATNAMRLVLLATNREGYGHLSELITLARTRADKGHYLARRSDLEGQATGHPHLQGLPGCLALLIPPRPLEVSALREQAQWLKRYFAGRAWIAAENLLQAGDDLLLEQVQQLAQDLGVPIVATGDVLMHVRSRKPLQDVVTAIRLGKPVNECGFELAPNAEQYLRPRIRLAQLYTRAWLEESLRIAKRCQFSLDELSYQYPQEIVPAGQTVTSHLRALTEAGVQRRFPQGVPSEVRATIEKELALIAELQYEAFFLTIEDIVRFARSQGILCQGRGSAANSVVCYCLGITEVDPRRCSLLFERFINRERNEPPDIDVDFEHQRREVVIQYIYQKYGRHRTALAATVICYRSRSALRDVGKALGLEQQQIDQVAKNHQWWDSAGKHAQHMREAGLEIDQPVVKLWLQLTAELRGFPRHLSQHVGGFVIARDSLARLVPIENASMENRSVIQWDKDDLEALKLIKVDVLALGMLSVVRRALEFISAKLGRPFAMSDVPDEDPATYDMICAADTVGTFQIESRAQMSMLPRLKPRTYYDLVVQVAIVRPGPIQGGMVHPFLKRRDGTEHVDYPSAEVKKILLRTQGVPIFQEQVIQLAVVAADFTPGEADGLRRSMAAWKRKGGVGSFRERLISRMIEKKYSADFAERLFKQIEGFGEYGFPESHAASFALVAYVSSWIKCHHPDAFLAALLNSQPMGFYAPAQLVQDAQRHGVEVRAVDINLSAAECSLEVEAALPAALDASNTTTPLLTAPQPAVRLGFNRISGLSAASIERLLQARAERAFVDIEDLALRVRLNRAELNALAASGALNSLAGHRRQARWDTLGIETSRPALLKQARFNEQTITIAAPSEGEDVLQDYAALGLTLGRHPLALLRPQLSRLRLRCAAELKTFPDKRLASACGIVTHRQRPQTANGTIFITLEDETGAVNVIIWKDLVERERRTIIGSRLLAVRGVWQSVSGVMNLLARHVSDQSHLLGQLPVASRDFH